MLGTSLLIAALILTGRAAYLQERGWLEESTAGYGLALTGSVSLFASSFLLETASGFIRVIGGVCLAVVTVSLLWERYGTSPPIRGCE